MPEREDLIDPTTANRNPDLDAVFDALDKEEEEERVNAAKQAEEAKAEQHDDEVAEESEEDTEEGEDANGEEEVQEDSGESETETEDDNQASDDGQEEVEFVPFEFVRANGKSVKVETVEQYTDMLESGVDPSAALAAANKRNKEASDLRAEMHKDALKYQAIEEENEDLRKRLSKYEAEAGKPIPPKKVDDRIAELSGDLAEFRDKYSDKYDLKKANATQAEIKKLRTEFDAAQEKYISDLVEYNQNKASRSKQAGDQAQREGPAEQKKYSERLAKYETEWLESHKGDVTDDIRGELERVAVNQIGPKIRDRIATRLGIKPHEVRLNQEQVENILNESLAICRKNKTPKLDDAAKAEAKVVRRFKKLEASPKKSTSAGTSGANANQNAGRKESKTNFDKRFQKLAEDRSVGPNEFLDKLL